MTSTEPLDADPEVISDTDDSDNESPSTGSRGRLTRFGGQAWGGIRSLNFYQVIFFGYLVVALLLSTFLVPPFQKSDEPAHFHRTVSLTNLDFFCDRQEDGTYYFEMKRKYAELPDIARTFDTAFVYDNKFNRDWLDVDFSESKWDEPTPVYRFCSLPIPGYFANAAGVLIGKPFTNPLVSFYLGRLAGAVFFVGAVIWALRVIPNRYTPIVYLYAVLPTVVHQVSAISYDAVHLSIFPVFFAYLTRFIVEQGPIRRRDLVIFLALLFWIVNVRLFAFLPFLLLFFVIHWAKITPRYSRYLMLTGGFMLITLAITTFFNLQYLPRAEDTVPSDAIDADLQRQFVLNNPWDFLVACYNTLRVRGEGLFTEMTAVFGWIDYRLNWLPYYLSVSAAAIVMYRTAQRDSSLLRPSQLLFLFGAIAGTTVFLFFSLYSVWTPVGHDIVDGLQGRYFLGLVPLTMLFIVQAAALVGKDRALKGLLLAVAIMILFNTYRAIDLRYY